MQSQLRFAKWIVVDSLLVIVVDRNGLLFQKRTTNDTAFVAN